MRHFLILSLLVLAAQPVVAQAYYAQQNYPAPANYPLQQQVTGNTYAGQSIYTPQDHVPPPQPAPQPSARTPLPSDYGQSVMTDIRQMNF